MKEFNRWRFSMSLGFQRFAAIYLMAICTVAQVLQHRQPSAEGVLSTCSASVRGFQRDSAIDI